MDKEKFIQMIHTDRKDFNADYVDKVVDMTLERIETDAESVKAFQAGSKLSLVLMEETSELVESISRRMRGRVSDNYDVLQECADVIIDVLCISKLFDISTADLQKAITAKCKRQEVRSGFDS